MDWFWPALVVWFWAAVKLGHVVQPPQHAARWAGPFLLLGPGYSTASGAAGVAGVAELTGGSDATPKLGSMKPEKYAEGVRTDRGNGIGMTMQLGYNIMGYASVWADLGWHGSFGGGVNTAGTGAGALMVGVHPLRMWRDDLDIDLRVYGGYGVYEINHYNETGFQDVAKGKAWTGSNATVGASFEYRLTESAISFGLDVREVLGSYNTWVYNFSNDVKAVADPAQARKNRMEASVTIGFHL